MQQLVNLDNKKPFVYTSGRYDQDFMKTTIAIALTQASHGNVLVYDLRHDPEPFVGLSQQELEKRLFASWDERKADGFVSVPVKPLQYNRCPAVAPIGVLGQNDGWQKIGLTNDIVDKNLKILLKHPEFAEKLRTAFENRPKPIADKKLDPESQLYDSFLPDGDKLRVEAVRSATERQLVDLQPEFNDERLPELLLHYKARNFPRSLSESELSAWEDWRNARIERQLPGVVQSITKLSSTELNDHQQFVLSELQLWIENVTS